jgi:hypothetical protein
MTNLFGLDGMTADEVLAERHYLGPSRRGRVYRDDFGVMVFANPSSRRLPHDCWFELVRWCITSEEKNAGSRQWRAAVRWLRQTVPDITTVVSYSDPSEGHTGALYRACNWLWAPTWHRLREPPTGNGTWNRQTRQAVKDRWVFCLKPDATRAERLRVEDETLRARMPWAEYREKVGGDYRQFRALQAVRRIAL